MLVDEGDDISNLEVPAESKPEPPKQASASTSPPSQSPPPTSESAPSTSESRAHVTPSSSRPLFPSVLRLLSENGINKADDIKGTGIRGMLTKGDVLTHLGKASGPLGTYKTFLEKEEQKTEKVEKKEAAPVPLDGLSIRRLIVSNMLEASIKKRTPPGTFGFNSIPFTITYLFDPVAPKAADFDDIIADYLPSTPKPKPTTPPATKLQSGSSAFLDGLV